jgi:hypothetical protein
MKWWVESDFKVPNIPFSLRRKVSGCHYNSINYSVSSYLKFIPICWNVFIWLKYDFMHHLLFDWNTILCIIFPCTLTYNLWDDCADTGSWIRGHYNSIYHIFCCNMLSFACPIIAKSQCWLFALRAGKYPYLPSNIHICPHISVFAPVFKYQVGVITVFTVFRLLTDFVFLYTYEFWLSLCKIARSSVILKAVPNSVK